MGLLDPPGLSKTAADAAYAQKPSGGTDGQALVKSGTGTAWATIASTQPLNRDGLALTPVDGGHRFLEQFRYSHRADPYFFPLTLHLPTVTSAADIAVDLSAGINTYYWLTTTSSLAAFTGSGVPLILQWGEWGPSYASWKDHSSVVGVALDDERDMFYLEPGYNDPTQAFADQRTQLEAVTKDGRFIIANYSKGVMFYNTDKAATRWVNEFSDITSNDVYWMTDELSWGQYQGGKYVNGSTAPLTQAQGQQGYLYGLTVKRMRDLASPAGSKPMFNCVELSHSAGNDTSPTITVPQIKSAVWHSIIAGARGISYFPQKFGASGLLDNNVLRTDATLRAALAGINALVTQMAPVINAPSVAGFATASAGVVAAVKYYNGDYYILAGSKQTGSQAATFTLSLPGYTSAVVVGESRTVALSGQVLTDTFADQNAVHLYKIVKG